MLRQHAAGISPPFRMASSRAAECGQTHVGSALLRLPPDNAGFPGQSPGHPALRAPRSAHKIRRIHRIPGVGFAGYCAHMRRLIRNGTPGQAQACGDSPCGVGCAGIASFRPGCRAEACHPRTLPVPQPVRRRHGRAACVLRCPVKESAGHRKYS